MACCPPLAATIPVVVQSRTRVSAASGNVGGALQQFRTDADTDTAAVRDLRTRLEGIERIGMLTGYDAIERKVLIAHEVKIRVDQLAAKYLAAADADERVREHLRAAALRLIGCAGAPRPASPDLRRGRCRTLRLPAIA
jgi:hypothetical protein